MFNTPGPRRYRLSNSNKVEHQCIRICSSVRLQRSARRACGRERSNQFGESVESWIRQIVKMKEVDCTNQNVKVHVGI